MHKDIECESRKSCIHWSSLSAVANHILATVIHLCPMDTVHPIRELLVHLYRHDHLFCPVFLFKLWKRDGQKLCDNKLWEESIQTDWSSIAFCSFFTSWTFLTGYAICSLNKPAIIFRHVYGCFFVKFKYSLANQDLRVHLSFQFHLVHPIEDEWKCNHNCNSHENFQFQIRTYLHAIQTRWTL